MGGAAKHMLIKILRPDVRVLSNLSREMQSCWLDKRPAAFGLDAENHLTRYGAYLPGKRREEPRSPVRCLRTLRSDNGSIIYQFLQTYNIFSLVIAV